MESWLLFQYQTLISSTHINRQSSCMYLQKQIMSRVIFVELIFPTFTCIQKKTHKIIQCQAFFIIISNYSFHKYKTILPLNIKIQLCIGIILFFFSPSCQTNILICFMTIFRKLKKSSAKTWHIFLHWLTQELKFIWVIGNCEGHIHTVHKFTQW